MKIGTYLVLLSVLVNSCVGYNILVVLSNFGKSHFLVFEPMLLSLANKGHNLTVISYFPQKKPTPNYRDISLLNGTESGSVGVGIIQFNNIHNSRLRKYVTPLRLASIARCESSFENSNFQNFLKEENKFDVILVEFFNTNCFMGLVKKYKAPVIGLSTCAPLPWIPDWFGNPDNPSYVPVIFMDYSDQMTFLERVENTLILVYNKLLYKYFIDSPGNEHSKKYLGEDLHEGGDIMYNTSLFLINTHFSLNRPRPLVPNFIEVGGIHVGKPKPLPLMLLYLITPNSQSATLD